MELENTALYRKYRPSKFGEVLGQEHIIKVLEESIKLGNISHAYLFSGSRGTGKTSVARILAREIGCSASDLYEIDAASNRGIDDIRELRESVNVLPLNSERKIYIIDEVHMLTKEAFNALLKTLEEPPKHVVFVLATTELNKLPETIVSRCQTFTFRKPNQSLLKKMVLDIAKREGYTIDPSSAELIAMLGDGSFRDAKGVLQKVISSSADKKISREEVEIILGAPSVLLVNNFIEAIVEKKLAKGIEAIKMALENNIAMDVYLKIILRKMRAVLLLRFAPEVRKQLESDFSEDDLKFIEDIAKNKGSNISAKTLYELLDSHDQLKYSSIPQLPLELALIKIIGDNTEE